MTEFIRESQMTSVEKKQLEDAIYTHIADALRYATDEAKDGYRDIAWEDAGELFITEYLNFHRIDTPNFTVRITNMTKAMIGEAFESARKRYFESK